MELLSSLMSIVVIPLSTVPLITSLSSSSLSHSLLSSTCASLSRLTCCVLCFVSFLPIQIFFILSYMSYACRCPTSFHPFLLSLSLHPLDPSSQFTHDFSLSFPLFPFISFFSIYSSINPVAMCHGNIYLSHFNMWCNCLL